MSKVKVSDGHEYVVDTSIVKAAILNYADEMRRLSPESEEDYDKIHQICFEILSDLVRAKIAIDVGSTISKEYHSQVFELYPSDYPARWFALMESRGRIVLKDINWQNDLRRKMHKFFHLSKTDCCLVHVAKETSTKKLLHRDGGIKNAAGFIRSNFGVEQVCVV